MKRILLALAALSISIASHAQAPQAVCYQAVATDQTGHELASQNIKVRLSILKGSANGLEEWVETHAVTTDGFGLFDLQIGNGTRVGGSQTTLSNIRWGIDRYFLKIEMDITGGNNYSLMGTNQLVSVPYALYSEKSYSATFADSSGKSGRATNADFAATAGLATRAALADSTVAASRALTAITAIRAIFSDSTAAAGRATRAIFADSTSASSRSVTSTRAVFADSANVASRSVTATTAIRAIFADSASKAGTASRAILADSASKAGFASKADSAKFAIKATTSDTAIRAITAMTAVRADTARIALRALGDLDGDPTNEIQSLLYRNDSLILTKPNGPPSIVQLTTQAFRAPGASIEFPLGILGEAIAITTNFVVPLGKSLYVSAVNDGVLLADGKQLYAEPGMPIIPEGNRISQCYCTGILIPNKADVSPIILDFTSPTFEYKVPDNFTLVIKSGKTSRGLLDLQIDSDTYSFYTVTSQSPRLIVITSGKRVKKPITLLPYDPLVVTGYLLKN
jgi:hypothetical protein